MSQNNQVLQSIHTSNCKYKSNKKDKHIKCILCNRFYHQRCHKVFTRTRQQINSWKCWGCLHVKATKCSGCKKTIARSIHPVKCSSCSKNFHKKCSKIPLKNCQNKWTCHDCCRVEIPFYNISNDDFIATINGIDNIDDTKLNLLPSYSVQTLLDKITNSAYVESGEINSETVNSKYYTPNEFIVKRFAKSKFSILHLNIVSLQAHINELRELIALVNYPFDLIAISETKLKKNCDILVNIDIDGSNFEKTETETFFGGVALYIKKSHTKYKVRKELSLSEKNIAESIFVEIERKNQKNIIAGCICLCHSELGNLMNHSCQQF